LNQGVEQALVLPFAVSYQLHSKSDRETRKISKFALSILSDLLSILPLALQKGGKPVVANHDARGMCDDLDVALCLERFLDHIRADMGLYGNQRSKEAGE
jgi:hypothetical protein